MNTLEFSPRLINEDQRTSILVGKYSDGTAFVIVDDLDRDEDEPKAECEPNQTNMYRTFATHDAADAYAKVCHAGMPIQGDMTPMFI